MIGNHKSDVTADSLHDIKQQLLQQRHLSPPVKNFLFNGSKPLPADKFPLPAREARTSPAEMSEKARRHFADPMGLWDEADEQPKEESPTPVLDAETANVSF